MNNPNDAAERNMSRQTPGHSGKVAIRRLPTGVHGLDAILGGGLPEYSFNIIAGMPGCGKTTLAHQIVFTNATEQKPALYITVLGEPALKMLRYQQQFSFFDASLLGRAVRFVNLGDVVMERDLNAAFDEIKKQVAEVQPCLVVVDSFRTMARRAPGGVNDLEMQTFIQRLGQFLTGWEATTFLVGEYVPEEIRDNPVFTISDGLIWLSQMPEHNSVVRKLHVMKMRGQASMPGLHTMRISGAGVQTFPRAPGLAEERGRPRSGGRLSTGIGELDRMLGGGVPEGDSVLVAGPSGTGKSALATHFIAEGLRRGEPGVVAVFEERPRGYVKRAGAFGLDLETPQSEGRLELLYLRSLDLSVDETLYEILSAIERTGARRLVIDSLAGFEMALAPGFRADFRESLYRMIGSLTGSGVTVLSTVEVEDSFTALTLTRYSVSFLSDDIIRTRYVEMEGRIRKVMTVIKTRGGAHSGDIREYHITDTGVVIDGHPVSGWAGLTSGLPERAALPPPRVTPP